MADDTGVVSTDPCPSWCSEPAGHPYTDGLDAPERWHRATVGAVEIEQVDFLRLTSDGLAVDRQPVTLGIRSEANGSVVDLTLEEMRRLLPGPAACSARRRR